MTPIIVIFAFLAGIIFGALLCDRMWRKSLQIVRDARERRIDMRA